MASLPDKAGGKYEYAVSACLAGIGCAYDGKSRLCSRIKMLVDSKKALPVCAETLGGLGCPRERSEITGGTGEDVLAGNASVVTVSGREVSSEFILGAKKALRLARRFGINKAILKSKSPSCGSGIIYDGTFRKIVRSGDGVLTSLLRQNAFTIYNEKSGISRNTCKYIR